MTIKKKNGYGGGGRKGGGREEGGGSAVFEMHQCIMEIVLLFETCTYTARACACVRAYVGCMCVVY